MRTLHEQVDGGEQIEPIRLSYHGRSHYNSVVPMTWTKNSCLLNEKPGLVENEAIKMSQNQQTEARL